MVRSKLAGWTTKQKTSLEDEDTFLEVLASHGRIVVDLLALELLPIKDRRTVDDFGLPTLFDQRSQTPL